MHRFRTIPVVAFTIVSLVSLLQMISLHAADDKTAMKFPAETPWGRIVAKETALELHVRKLPDNRIVSFPRLNNRMKSVYIEGQTAEQSKLRFKPEVSTWEVTVPRETGDFSGVIVFETMEPVHLPTKPYVVKQSNNGEITLPAHHVVTHGKLLRYEPQPHKNTLGYWANADDWAEWHLSVADRGQFEVEILQGCGKGQGGSIVEIEVPGSRCRFEIEDTGHFQNFKRRKVGYIDITKAGTLPLKIRTIVKAKVAACDIREIRLVPVSRP